MLRFARREPSAILLAMQLAGVLLYPFMEGSDVGRALFSVFGIAVLGLVVLAVQRSPGLTWVALLLGLPATVLLLIQAIERRASRPRSTRRATAAGWSCCSSASPRSPARG